MRSYADAIGNPETVIRGEILFDPFFGEVVVESVYFQGGDWHFTTTSEGEHEPA
jgi:hypothetical protein